MSLENARYRRRNWNRKKSYLPKYSSLPELHLLPKERPLFHCRRCGFTNTLIPLCLWCTWTSKEAEHEFELSTPRARRASAPARVFFHVESVSTHEQNNPPPDHQHASSTSSYTSLASKRPMNSSRKRDTPCFPENPLPAARFTTIPEVPVQEETMNRDLGDGGPVAGKRNSCVQPEHFLQSHRDLTGEPGDVPTATPSRSSLVFAQARTASQGDPRLNLRRLNANSSTDLRDPLLLSLPSEGQPVAPTVNHSPPPMTPMKSFRNLKASRRLLIIDINDTKKPSGDNDTHEPLTILNSPINQDGSKPSSPIRPDILPRQQQLRTLRRKKHLNIMQPSIRDASAAGPIAISLTLRSPSSQRALKSPQQPHPTSPTRTLTHSHSRTLSQPRSIASESSSEPMTPPLSPTQLPPPPSTAPAKLTSTTPTSSPVRLGHPSRPYYSAIRKGGISPPPSRPASIMGPALTSTTTRPQSYTPPSSFPASALNSTTASRHLSMSAMFVSPPYSAPGDFSAFSVMDDVGNDEDDDEDDLPILPPTPAPARISFTLSSASRRLSQGSQVTRGHGHGHGHAHSNSMSLSQARVKGGSIGFSMSGETELRMALAAGAASAGVVEDGFRFRETTLSAGSNVGGGLGAGASSDIRPATAMRAGSRNSFMGRVKKLRKGLKEMLLMTSTTTTAAATNA